MTVKVALRLAGLDLRDVESYLRIPEELGQLGFQSKGPISYAVMYSDSERPAYEAADWAHRVAKLMPGVRVIGVYEELVGVATIASRCGVAAEAVRLWSTGQRRASLRPFPAPREVVEQGRSGKLAPLFSWAEVVAWVRDVLGEDPEPDCDFLAPAQVADLNAELAHLEAVPSDGAMPRSEAPWQPIREAQQTLTSRRKRRGASTFAASGQALQVLETISESLVENHATTARTRKAQR